MKQLKETSISNDSLENANEFFDRNKRTFRGVSAGDYLEKDDFMAFAENAVNNYNALKQSNKELIEALDGILNCQPENLTAMNFLRVKALRLVSKAKQL